jgi:hypothetical protein
MKITDLNLQTGYIYKQQNTTVIGYTHMTATVMVVVMITEYRNPLPLNLYVYYLHSMDLLG